MNKDEFKKKLKYASMFSGIGGFELGIRKAIPNTQCVFSCEADKYATENNLKMSHQLTFGQSKEQTFQKSILFAVVSRARILALPVHVADLKEKKAVLSLNSSGLYESKNLNIYCSKMLKGCLAQMVDGISPGFSLNWKTSGTTLNGAYLTQKTMVFPNTGKECTLSDILEEHPDPKYFLSDKATKLRRKYYLE